MNTATLIGNVGQDPKTTVFENGNKVANVTLATTKKFKTSTGEVKTDTQWHSLSFFGKLAEVVEKYVKKGDKIAVVGEIVYRKYTDKNGVEKINTEIRVDNLEMLSGPKNNTETAPTPPPTPPTQQEDDLPF